MGMTPLPLFVLLLLICFCKSDDRLTPSKPLSPGDKLVSNGGIFALGFFSLTNSTANSYIGIWYHHIPERTYVWVANRDNPIASSSHGNQQKEDWHAEDCTPSHCKPTDTCVHLSYLDAQVERQAPNKGIHRYLD
ncbi:hypothetical protein ACQJBY_018096 [Aegilops geniculata]